MGTLGGLLTTGKQLMINQHFAHVSEETWGVEVGGAEGPSRKPAELSPELPVLAALSAPRAPQSVLLLRLG